MARERASAGTGPIRLTKDATVMGRADAARDPRDVGEALAKIADQAREIRDLKARVARLEALARREGVT